MKAAELFTHSKTFPSIFAVNTNNASEAQLVEISDELGLCLNLQEMISTAENLMFTSIPCVFRQTRAGCRLLKGRDG